MYVYVCMFTCPEVNPEDSAIMLVAVPLLILLIVAMAVCALVVWLRSRRPHYRLTHMEDHDATMLKVPAGADPTYGVRSAPVAPELTAELTTELTAIRPG